MPLSRESSCDLHGGLPPFVGGVWDGEVQAGGSSGVVHPGAAVQVQREVVFSPVSYVCGGDVGGGVCSYGGGAGDDGVWYTPELHKALEFDYVVLKVWHWEERSCEVFRDYVNCFAKKKQEASGWPASFRGDEKTRRRYVEEYRQHEGVELDPDEAKYNPGIRSLAKLMLNSLLGKFAQNPASTGRPIACRRRIFTAFCLTTSTRLRT